MKSFLSEEEQIDIMNLENHVEVSLFLLKKRITKTIDDLEKIYDQINNFLKKCNDRFFSIWVLDNTESGIYVPVIYIEGGRIPNELLTQIEKIVYQFSNIEMKFLIKSNSYRISPKKHKIAI